MHLGRARRRRSIATIWRVVLPRTIVSSTMTTRLPATSVERVVLHADALLAHALFRLDEGPADVAVLDQALAEGDAALAREADGGRRARVGDRHDEVGLDGSLARELLAHAHARAVDLDAVDASSRGARDRRTRRCRTCPGLPAARPACVHALLVDDDQLARRDLPHYFGAHEVERAALGRDDRVAVERPSVSGRNPCGSRNATSLPSADRRDRCTRPRASPSRSRPPARAAPRRSRSAPR